MRLYEGFTRGDPGAASWPRRWLVVAVELAAGGGEASARQRRSTLARWAGALLQCQGPAVQAVETLGGASVGSFWSLLLALHGGRGPLWLCSPRALMAWQTLGLWEKIEAGTIRLDRSRRDSVEHVLWRGTGKSAGVLATDDPPSIVKAWIGDDDLPFTWVCAGNYGLEPERCGFDAAAESAALASAIGEASAVMDAHDLGGWACTAGSTALRGWQRTYQGRPLYRAAGSRPDPLESAVQRGGLLLAQLTGSLPVEAWSVDVRSMYPWIAAHQPQATDLERKGIANAEAEKAARRSPLACIAEVVPKEDYAGFWQRARVGYGGAGNGCLPVLCGPELEEAHQAGAIERVTRCNVYRLGTPLDDYERRCWEARRWCSDGPARAAAPFIKRLGVSLIGKLAESVQEWEECVPDITDPLWGSWDHFLLDGRRVPMRARAGITESGGRSRPAAHSLLPVPLWIWAYGRRRMRQCLNVVGKDTVLVLDTDGMLLSREGYERLVATGLVGDGSWGSLRLVSGPMPCVVRSVKDFTLGDRLVCAGVPRRDRVAGELPRSPSWYRLPWDQLSAPEARSCWIEKAR